ncbi:nodal homolog 2-B [Xenopus laevis]|uniref:TGF-beta family profile domain-containing protein n=2 Tax=Xenopus laevis TaxID=8355 RepID=A0A974HQC8_XENLA|nr:nodal homolog 2-B [Xenopus laevis]OCT86449.1 hypothetical protein XELAEV_18020132mg [Xenopus laevis]
MASLGAILLFAIASLMHGRPIHSDRKGAKIPLAGSNLGYKKSSNMYGSRLFQGMRYPPSMIQLYQTLILGNDTDLSILEYPVLQESDAVLSFIAKSCVVVGNRWTLSFDMSSISSTNELKLAELRIRLPSFERPQDVTVEIYHTKKGQENLFMGSFKTNPSVAMGSSWKVFNLTRMLQYYLHQGEQFTNDEYIEVKNLHEGAKPQVIKRRARTEVEEGLQGNKDNTPTSSFPTERVVLVVFTRDKPTANHFGSPSLIHTVESSKYVMSESTVRVADARRHRRNQKTKNTIIMNTIPSRSAGNPLCRRVDMIVDFEKIKWGDRIVYPKRFNAYRCEGACPIPLNETFKPTNHAYIKSLVKLYDQEKVECSSCVPVKMSPLSMLLYEDGEVVLKHHEDMIVDECGCN